MTFDPTKPVQTRDGRKARIICTDAVGNRPIITLTLHGSTERAGARFLDGSYMEDGPSCMDLINIPEEPKTIEGWVNVWRGGDAGSVFKTKAAALGVGPVVSRIACVPITIKYRPGEGLEDE